MHCLSMLIQPHFQFTPTLGFAPPPTHTHTHTTTTNPLSPILSLFSLISPLSPSQLSGMPECKFGLNDKLIMEKESADGGGATGV